MATKKNKRISGDKTGRPSKLTEEIKIEIKRLIELGLNYKDVCESVGIAEETFIQWRKKFPEFSELVAKANAKVKEISLKSIRVGELKDWKAAAWRLERRWPDEYKEKKQLEVNELPNLVQNVFPIEDGEEKDA